MTRTSLFSPDWASPPGDTIADLLDEKKIAIQDFADQIGISEQQAKNLLSGRKKITPKLAKQLQQTIGSSSEFWKRREFLYQQRLKKLQSDHESPNATKWLRELPLKDLIRFGWVEEKFTKTQQINACLRFFGVTDVENWYAKYEDMLGEALFRTSPTFTSHLGAVAAWLRKGELQGVKIQCRRWDSTKFRDTIQVIRSLTREQDPEIFIPEIEKHCAESGVAVVIIRAPKGCRASGASLFLTPHKALIILSFRYLSDDHFWYTFFHEAAHLIMHGKKDLFIDSANMQLTKEEEEANEFSANVLIPSEFQDEFSKLRVNGRKIVRFAKRIGVSPGIIVGQLQHHGIIGHNQLNNLKIRYTWDSS